MQYSFGSLKSLALGAVITMSVLSSCKKDRPDTDTQSSVDNSICEGEFTRMFPVTSSIAVGDSGVQKGGLDIPVPMGGCPDYLIDSADVANGFPITMFMYYGADNDGDGIYETPCKGSDGKDRRGIIRAVFSAPWSQVGATITHSLQDYYVNNIQYEGSVVVTRGVNSFNQVVTGGKCTKGNLWTILWDCDRTFTYDLGDTTNHFDDVVLMTGSASGTSRLNQNFTVDIDPTQPLRKEMSCPYVSKGVLTVKIEGKKDRTIDYGDGTCDNRAKLIIDGNEFEFTLQ